MQDLPTREEYRKQQEELKKKNTQQDNISKREEIRKKDESLEQNYRPKKKKLRFKKWVIAIFLLFFLSLLTISGLEIYNWLNDNNKTNNLQDDIVDNTKIKEKKDTKKTEQVNPPENKSDDYWDYMKMNLLEVDFNEKNSDTVGWIQVKGTNINYPIVQTTNNDYYLDHAFDKTENKAGWVFMDYRNNPVDFNQNTIIYAHSRYNGTMFGSLKNILNSSWYTNKENHIIRLSTPTENTMWQVFSVYTIEKESYYITPSFSSTESYQNFLSTIKGRSEVDFSGTVNTGDKVLTLSTCKDNFGNRIVMHAKLIKKEVR